MILVRHGEGTWNVHFHAVRVDVAIHDPRLTETGTKQAELASERLEGFGIRRLIASPYTRTLQTASVIGRRLGLDIEVDPLVRERCAFACDQGTPISTLKEEWPAIDFTGLEEIWWGRRIESQISIGKRVEQFGSVMAERADADATAVVSHWGFIRAATGLSVGNADLVSWGGLGAEAVVIGKSTDPLHEPATKVAPDLP